MARGGGAAARGAAGRGAATMTRGGSGRGGAVTVSTSTPRSGAAARGGRGGARGTICFVSCFFSFFSSVFFLSTISPRQHQVFHSLRTDALRSIPLCEGAYVC